MAARSSAKTRSRGQAEEARLEAVRRTRRRVFAAAMVLTVVSVIGWQADRWLDVHVKKVQIEGELSGSEREAVMDTIATAIESSGAQGLHSLSLEEVQTAVQQLSWADRVSARRRWPDTLVVRLMRHSVVARWGGGGLVATNGEVIIPAGTETDSAGSNGARVQGYSDPRALDAGLSLPLLNCTHASSARAMEVFSVLNSALSQADLRLVRLDESELGEWSAGVEDPSTGRQISVALGRDDLGARLHRFLVVRDSLLAQTSQNEASEARASLSQVAAVDARYHNGVAVRFRADADETPTPLLNDATRETLR